MFPVVEFILITYWLMMLIFSYIDCHIVYILSNEGDTLLRATFKALLWPVYIKTYNPFKMVALIDWWKVLEDLRS